MPNPNPMSLWRAFLGLPNESMTKTAGMALLVSGVCALAVAATAVVLEPRREANLKQAQVSSMLSTLRTLPGLGNVLDSVSADQLETNLVEVASGEVQTAHVLRVGGKPTLVVLPVSGRGYQSVLEGYLVLQGDLNTIAALTFYKQQETPGIGTRVTDPKWLSTFRGKELLADDGRAVIDVVQGGATGPHQVDGISGATRTSNGVENLLRFWMGPRGYGPFLRQLQEANR